jgi:hypothetical protein
MPKVDREGTFRGLIIDHGVSKSSGGFPQFVAEFAALEYYDEDAEAFGPWGDYEQTIVGYFVLYDKNGKPTLNLEQICKVLGWDGASFKTLNDGDYSEVTLQFRVAENTYENNTSLQIEWIDEEDAEPGRKVRKLDKAGLEELDSLYSSVMNKKAPAKAPAKGPKTPPKKPKTPKATPPAKGPMSPPAAKEETPPPPDEVEDKTPDKGKVDYDLPETCTKQEAWIKINELKKPNIEDDYLSELWTATIEGVAPGVAKGKVTPAQWAEIRDAMLEDVGIPF